MAYPEIPDKVIDWGPGVHHVNLGDAGDRFDIDACLSLTRGGAIVTPDGDPTTIASLGIHTTQEPGDHMLMSNHIELTGADCLTLALDLLAAIEAAGGATMWIVQDPGPRWGATIEDDPADAQRKGA